MTTTNEKNELWEIWREAQAAYQKIPDNLRFRPDCPKLPYEEPREPKELVSRWDDIGGKTDDERLGDLIERVLDSVDLDMEEVIPKNVREIFDSILVSATSESDSCGDPYPRFQLSRETMVPNPFLVQDREKYEADKKRHREILVTLPKRIEEFLASKQRVEDMKERAEYERLKAKFEK